MQQLTLSKSFNLLGLTREDGHDTLNFSLRPYSATYHRTGTQDVKITHGP
jgi:hypothetical protein